MNNFDQLIEQMNNFDQVNEQIKKHRSAQVKKPDEKYKTFALESDLRYTDHFQYRGIEYIKTKNKISLNDELIDKVLEADSMKIKTPLEEWTSKYGYFINKGS
tara:strand:+ start:1327 stop:1635 length:309 start_codon:yes stop_codon:yes gene_type:complete